jgi:hypothetical protein
MSITTPSSSLKRGDWGLKRSLPLRSTTKTSTPVIKVKAMDTWEHITEFGSAADHTLTLEKWQEMAIPLTAPVINKRASNYYQESLPGRSVFEDDLDTLHNSKNLGLKVEENRWRYGGPWLAGQTDGEFNEYVSKSVRSQKGAFREFLRTGLAEEKRKQKMLQEGIDDENTPLPTITDAELETHVKVLRRDPSALNSQIRRFFDIVPVANDNLTNDFSLSFLEHKPTPKDTNSTTSPYAVIGPPSTHPSAGLSYSRTASKLNNHPVFGPQKSSTIVEARIVLPRTAITGSIMPVLGLGGFIADVPTHTDTSFDYTRQHNTPLVPGLIKIVPEKAGGSKVWMRPRHAYVDSQGQVQLAVAKADVASVAIKEGRTDELAKIVQPAEVRSIRTSPFARARGETTSSVILPSDEKYSGARGYGL